MRNHVYKEKLHVLSGKWGPYQTIEQCLDCLERMKTDTLRSFPGYELKNSLCRNEPGQAFGSREYPNSSSGT